MFAACDIVSVSATPLRSYPLENPEVLISARVRRSCCLMHRTVQKSTVTFGQLLAEQMAAEAIWF
jgi:hypothetical protein